MKPTARCEVRLPREHPSRRLRREDRDARALHSHHELSGALRLSRRTNTASRLEQLEVGRNFNPEVGFLRRTNFRRSFFEGRYSPRPRRLRARPAVHVRSRHGLHPRPPTVVSSNRGSSSSASSRSSRTAIVSSSTPCSICTNRSTSLSKSRATSRCRLAATTSGTPSSSTNFGRQRKAPPSGSGPVATGTFYDGDITVLEFTSARVEVTRPAVRRADPLVQSRQPARGPSHRSWPPHARELHVHAADVRQRAWLQDNSSNDRVSANVRLPGNTIRAANSSSSTARTATRNLVGSSRSPGTAASHSSSIDCSGIDLHRNSGDQGRSPVQKALRLLFFCESDKCVASIEHQNRIVVTLRDRAAILIGHHVSPLSSRRGFRQGCRCRCIDPADLFNVRSSRRAAVRVLSAFLLPESARSGPRLASLWRCHSPHRFH